MNRYLKLVVKAAGIAARSTLLRYLAGGTIAVSSLLVLGVLTFACVSLGLEESTCDAIYYAENGGSDEGLSKDDYRSDPELSER